MTNLPISYFANLIVTKKGNDYDETIGSYC